MGTPVRLGSGPGELNVVLTVERGCYGCDGPPTSVDRVYRDASGVLRREMLFAKPEGAKYLTSVAAAAPDRILVMACFGECYEVGAVVRNGYSVLYESLDGGLSWPRETRFEHSALVLGPLSDGEVLLRRSVWIAGVDDFDVWFEVSPGGRLVSPALRRAYPVVVPGIEGHIVWRVEGSGELLNSNGGPFALPNLGGSAVVPGSIEVIGASPDGASLVVAWTRTGLGGDERRLAGLARDGKLVLAWPSLDLTLGPWLDDHRSLGTASLQAKALGLAEAGEASVRVPVVVDFATGEVRPIEVYGPFGLDSREAYSGRNRVVAVSQPGP